MKRRGGIIGTIRNCCFDTMHHEWLLDSGMESNLEKVLAKRSFLKPV
jgi:hypothetical protein